jgi:[ribosomal protein S5]-alanine N-acetyltransferase
MGIPVLRTERLVLREPTLADAPAVLVFRGDPRVQRFNDEPLRDVAAAEAFIRFLRADSASDARRHWAITIDDEVVGLIGLHTWQSPAGDSDLAPPRRDAARILARR